MTNKRMYLATLIFIDVHERSVSEGNFKSQYLLIAVNKTCIHNSPFFIDTFSVIHLSPFLRYCNVQVNDGEIIS